MPLITDIKYQCFQCTDELQYITKTQTINTSFFSPPPLLLLSDNHICGGGDHPPDPHLPADQNPHRHRPHPGVQQVSYYIKIKTLSSRFSHF